MWNLGIMITKKLSLVIFYVMTTSSLVNSIAYADDFGDKILLLTIHVSKNTIQNGEV